MEFGSCIHLHAELDSDAAILQLYIILPDSTTFNIVETHRVQSICTEFGGDPHGFGAIYTSYRVWGYSSAIMDK